MKERYPNIIRDKAKIQPEEWQSLKSGDFLNGIQIVEVWEYEISHKRNLLYPDKTAKVVKNEHGAIYDYSSVYKQYEIDKDDPKGYSLNLEHKPEAIKPIFINPLDHIEIKCPIAGVRYHYPNYDPNNNMYDISGKSPVPEVLKAWEDGTIDLLATVDDKNKVEVFIEEANKIDPKLLEEFKPRSVVKGITQIINQPEHLYFKCEFYKDGVYESETVVEDAESIADYMRYRETELDDPDQKAEVRVSGIGLTKAAFKEIIESQTYEY